MASTIIRATGREDLSSAVRSWQTMFGWSPEELDYAKSDEVPNPLCFVGMIESFALWGLANWLILMILYLNVHIFVSHFIPW